MCGRFVLTAPGRLVAEHFQLGHQPQLEPRYNIAPSQGIAVVRTSPESDQRELTILRWGLIPFWARDTKIGYKMINARGESVATKPAFRAAFKQRRCLIPASGFYEWKREKRRKQPYYFQIKAGEIFAFAGLWERWKDPAGNSIESCTIITTEANALLAPIHDRMPVILDRHDYDQWLDIRTGAPDQLQKLCRPFPAEEMKSHPVSTAVNSPSHDAPECIEMVSTAEQT